MSFLTPRPHIVLMIGDDGVATVPHRVANPAPFFTPVEARNGVQEITSFLARHPTARLTLCVDNLAQDYRGDSLPPLAFFDRAKLVQRRLKQHFPAARLSASVKEKRARNRFMMIGLHDGNPVFAWAEKLRFRLPSIALLPVEGARLATRLMPEAKTGWAMTVSRHKTGGFRQIVTRGGDLVFTRLTPLPPDGSSDDSVLIARDIKASLDYLSRHGLRQASDLSVLLLMPGDNHLAQSFAALGLKAVTALSPFQAARQLGLPFAPQPDDSYSDVLFAAALATRRPALALMLPEICRARRAQIIRRWGMRTACVALALALGHTLWGAGDLVSILLDTSRQTAQAQKTREQLAREQANAAPVTEPLGRLLQAVERRRIYDQPTPAPWHGLDETAKGLTNDVKIVTIGWKKKEDAAPESFTLELYVPPQADGDNRAQSVAVFTAATQRIASAAPDYTVTVTRTPYPDMAQDAVTAAPAATDPVGEMILQRKMP